jgi:apolipoprotein N-acyltransferase
MEQQSGAHDGRRRRPSRQSWALAGLGLLCGASLNLAFPPVGWWWLAPLPVAGLSALTAGRTGKQGAFIGLGFGLGFAWVMFQWLRVLGPGAQEALGTLEALYFVPLGWGLARVSKLRLAPLWQPCLWVGQELLRARFPFGGMPWGKLAFSQPRSPFTPLAAVAGTPLLSFAVALTGVLLWRAGVVVMRDRRSGIRVASVFAVAAVVVPVLGFAVPLRSPDSGRPFRLALVQGNVPRIGLDYLGQQSAVLNNHVKATLDFARQVKAGTVPKPDAVVWPENASDIDPFTDPAARAEIDSAVQQMGVPVLVGAVVDAPDGTNVYNRMIVWDPSTGPGQTYDKRHLVPFGEYLPFRSLLTKVITRFNRIPRDFLPGHRVGVVDLAGVPMATAICFEVAYDGVVRDAVNGGGQALLVPSNNATYGHTGQTQQQLAISQVRAVEHGRWVVEAATSGVSAVVAPDGRVVQQTGEYVPAVIDAQVYLSTYRTLADRVGAWPEWLAAFAGLLAAMLAVGRGRGLALKARRKAGNLPGADADQNSQKTITSSEREPSLRLAVKGRAR